MPGHQCLVRELGPLLNACKKENHRGEVAYIKFSPGAASDDLQPKQTFLGSLRQYLVQRVEFHFEVQEICAGRDASMPSGSIARLAASYTDPETLIVATGFEVEGRNTYLRSDTPVG
jgi:hypothetical protein